MHVRAWAQEVATLRPHLLRPHPIRPNLLLDVVNGVAGGLDDALFAVLASALGLLDVCLLLGEGGVCTVEPQPTGVGLGVGINEEPVLAQFMCVSYMRQLRGK